MDERFLRIIKDDSRGTAGFMPGSALSGWSLWSSQGASWSASLSSAIVWDLTSDHVYTLAPETQQLLAQAVEPIKFKVLAPEQPQAKVLSNLVNQLRTSGAEVTLELVDPMRAPKRAQEALITADSPKIIVRYQGREACAPAYGAAVRSRVVPPARDASPGLCVARAR